MKRHAKIVAVGALLMCGGCNAPKGVPVKETSLFLQTVGDEYVHYVHADSSLTDAERRIRMENVEAFRALVKRVSRAPGGTP